MQKHDGRLLKEYMKKQRMKVGELSDKTGFSEDQLYNMFKMPLIAPSRLKELSQAGVHLKPLREGANVNNLDTYSNGLRERFLSFMEECITAHPKVKSTADFLEIMQVARPQLTRWRNGYVPDSERLLIACNELGASADYLLLGSGPKMREDSLSGRLQKMEDRLKRLELLNLPRAKNGHHKKQRV